MRPVKFSIYYDPQKHELREPFSLQLMSCKPKSSEFQVSQEISFYFVGNGMPPGIGMMGQPRNNLRPPVRGLMANNGTAPRDPRGRGMRR